MEDFPFDGLRQTDMVLWSYMSTLLIQLSSWIIYLGVSKNRGTQKWMVYFMENLIKMDDLRGFPIFLETPIYTKKPVKSGEV